VLIDTEVIAQAPPRLLLLVQLVMEGVPRATMETVLGFSTSVGLPVTLAEIGLADLPADLLGRIARNIMRE